MKMIDGVVSSKETHCECGNKLTWPDEYVGIVKCHACYIYSLDPMVQKCDLCNVIDENFFVFTDEEGDEEVICLECIRGTEEYEFSHPKGVFGYAELGV